MAIVTELKSVAITVAVYALPFVLLTLIEDPTEYGVYALGVK